MTFIWGNWLGFAVVIGWFVISLLIQQPIEQTIGQGYFMAATCGITDLAYRFFIARARISGMGVPTRIDGQLNAEAHWLTSKLGATFFSIPVWIGAVLVAIGAAALASAE